MEPQCHLSLTEEIREALAEAQFPTWDDLAATAAPGATAWSGYEEVSHDGKDTSNGLRSTSAPSAHAPRFFRANAPLRDACALPPHRRASIRLRSEPGVSPLRPPCSGVRIHGRQ